MSLPPGYLLTWHTYGTWLHGDEAGSVDELHNRFGTPRLEADPARFQQVRRDMTHPPLVLTHTSRILVDHVIREHCRIRHWSLRALAVRSNHVHAVIGEPLIKPEPIVKQLKDWGTRKLRSLRIVGVKQLVWADHGSMIYLYEPGTLERAIEYVLEQQDQPPPGHGRRDWKRDLEIEGR